MKKIWLVGLGAMLVTAMSANASLSFVWSHAQPPTISTPTEIQWVDSTDGGPVTVTAQLFGSGISFSASLLTSGTFAGDELFSVTSTSPFSPGKPDTGSFLRVTATPGVPAGSPAFNIVTTNAVTGPGEPVLTFPTSTIYDFGIVAPGGGTTASLVESNINFFSAIPEANTLAIALGAAVIGATVLFRSRRSSVA